MRIKFIDKSKRFMRENVMALDEVLGNIAIDIDRLSKQQVPHQKGQLKASGRAQRIGLLRHIVSYNKEYALYQHEGKRANGSHIIRQHSKPGKKTHYLIDPALVVTKQAIPRIKAILKRIKV